MVWKLQSLMGIFVWKQVFRRFVKWNLTSLNFTLGRIRVRWNWWSMGRRGGRKINNSGKKKLEPVLHSWRVLKRSFPTNFWDRNCWKVVCLHFQGQEKNLLIYSKSSKKVPQWWRWTHNGTGNWLLGAKIWCYWQCLETRATRYGNFCLKGYNLWSITNVSLARQ